MLVYFLWFSSASKTVDFSKKFWFIFFGSLRPVKPLTFPRNVGFIFFGSLRPVKPLTFPRNDGLLIDCVLSP